MIIRYNKIGDPNPERLPVEGELVRVGSHRNNNIVLNSPLVSGLAAIVTKSEQGWELTAKCSNGVVVNGHEIHEGEKTILLADAQVEIYPYELFFDAVDETQSVGESRGQLDDKLSQFLIDIHKNVIKEIDPAMDTYQPDDPDWLRVQEENIDQYASIAGLSKASNVAVLEHSAGMTVSSDILTQVLDESNAGTQWKNDALWSKNHSAVEQFESDLAKIVDRITRKLGLTKIEDKSKRIEAVEAGFWEQWEQVTSQIYPELLKYLGFRYVKKQIKDIMFGYGPLEDLLRLPSVSEVMVVSRDQIYIEKGGVLEKTGRRFVSDEVTTSIIDRIVSKVGRRIDKSDPLVDARLTDGSRVNAVIPPIAINGPCITIRKFPDQRMRIDQLVKFRSLTPAAARFLQACVVSGANILVSGGTGSGKTTLLNCLSDFIPDKDRIVTIEDTAELQLAKEHVVRMETKPVSREGTGEYDIRRLVENSLRMRPDRIVVGECRGPEALDMLQAMNTGHDGSMTTIHANTAEDVILRLEVLVQQAADLPVQSIHRQIASAIHLVVQLARLENGRRCVTQITEFVTYDETEQEIVTKDIFRLGADGYDAPLLPTGSLPSFMPRLIEKKLLDLDLFYS